MRLRNTIRPPTRYGEGVSPDSTAELLQSIRSGREQTNGEGAPTLEANTTNIRHRPSPIRPRIVEYNPNLPPASFPTMNEPRPSGQNGGGRNNMPNHLGNANVNTVSQGAIGRDLLINGQHFENHIASNNLQNPTYARNVRAMAGASCINPNTDSAYVSSDTEMEGVEGKGISSSGLAGLVAATPRNPAWTDLSPSLQVEIAMNLVHQQTFNWWTVCSKLGLTDKESYALSTLMRNRNKAIEREDNLLEEMRDKQLKCIKDLDHSEIKEHNVPPELVLRKLARDQDACRTIEHSTYREIAKLHTTGMLNAKISDVLTARQYLGRRGLPRSLAGVWGNGLVTMIEGQDDENEPERFEWKEDLKLKPHEVGDAIVHSLGGGTLPDKVIIIRDLGKETTVNPSNLFPERMRHDPIRGFENNVPWWHSRARPGPRFVSDAQALFQWKLDQARREAEETRRIVEKNLGRGERTPTETQGPEPSEGAEEAFMDYDWNDPSLFQFVNFDGKLVPTGVVDSIDTRLFGDAI